MANLKQRLEDLERRIGGMPPPNPCEAMADLELVGILGFDYADLLEKQRRCGESLISIMYEEAGVSDIAGLLAARCEA